MLENNRLDGVDYIRKCSFCDDEESKKNSQAYWNNWNKHIQRFMRDYLDEDIENLFDE